MTTLEMGSVVEGYPGEREAIEKAQGDLLSRVRFGLGALHRLLKDPNDTKQVFVAGIALNAGAFPALLARIVADDAGFALAADAPTIDSRSVDYDKLRALPADTLGGAYVRYLDDNHLDPDLFKPPPGLSKLPQWVVTRIRQTHDVWHALTGYGPDVEGEVALQAFSYAQLRVPSALLIALVGTVAKVPHAAPKVWRAYVRGKRAAFLPVVRFEDHWQRPLADVQRELGIEPAR